MPRRCPMPREKPRTRSWATLSMPTSSMTSSTRSRGEGVALREGEQVRVRRPAGVPGARIDQRPHPLHRPGQLAVGPAEHRHLSRGGPGQAEDAAHRRRLARAVRAEESGDPARLDGHGEVVDGDAGAVLLGQADDLDHPSSMASAAARPEEARPAATPPAPPFTRFDSRDARFRPRRASGSATDAVHASRTPARPVRTDDRQPHRRHLRGPEGRPRPAGPGRRRADHAERRAHPGQRPLAEGGPAGAGPPRRRLPPAREDHALRPRADPGARGARPRRRSARRLHGQRRRRDRDPRRRPGGEGPGDAGLRAVLHRARLARLGRHGARHPRIRDEVLHEGGHLGPRRQQHPGLLHPGRDQVPRHHPRGQAAPRPGDPAGAVGARHLLGLRHPPHRGHPPHDLEHERPGHPAQLPDDGGLRRPHVPAGQRPAGDVAGQVPLEAAPRRPLPDLGGGADRRGRRPRLPPPRPLRRHRERRLPRVGPRHPGLPRHPGGDLRGHRPARPHQDRAGGARAGAGHRHAGPERQPDQLLRRDRAGGLPHRAPGAGDRAHQRPAAGRPELLLPRHPADPARWPELHPDPDQPAARPGERQHPGRLPPARRPHRAGALHAEQRRRRRPVPLGLGRGRLRERPAARGRATSSARRRRRSPTTSPSRRCSTRA